MKKDNNVNIRILRESIESSFTDEQINKDAENALIKAKERGENPSSDYVEGTKNGMKIASKTILLAMRLIENMEMTIGNDGAQDEE